MKFFPVLQTLKTYDTKKFRWDLFAGITLAMFVLPESMAYATLAGLPTQFGIYCCLAGGLFFAFFTSTQQVAVGPTSAISLMIGSGVSVMSNGNLGMHIAIASLAALAVFIFCIAAYLLKLSSLVNFVSDNVLIGFKTGAALSIAATQIPKLFGLHAEGSHFFARIYNLLNDLGNANWQVFAFALCALALLISLNYFFPGKPTSLILVLASIFFVLGFPDLTSGLHLAGNIPAGLPSIEFPSIRFRDVDGILGLAFGCFIMAYIETSSVARTFAEKNNQDINLRQELLSLGAANFAAAFSGGYPVSGGLSQSQVNAQAGAKTSITLIICSVILAVLLLFFTGFLSNLPEVILAVLVLFAISHLIKIQELKKVRKLNKAEFAIALVAIFSVLFFGILKGVLISSVLSIIYVINQTSRPHVAVLGRIPGTKMYSDIESHADNELFKNCVIVRPEASLLYFNQQNVYDTILGILAKYPDSKLLIMDFSTSPRTDVMGSKMIVKLESYLKEHQIKFRIVEALSEVRDILRKQGLESSIGKISRRVSLDEVVQEFLSEKPAKQ